MLERGRDSDAMVSTVATYETRFRVTVLGSILNFHIPSIYALIFSSLQV